MRVLEDLPLLSKDTFSCTDAQNGIHKLIKYNTHTTRHTLHGGIIETWFCPVRDVPSSVWFVRLYYTQIQLVIRLLLDHSKKPPQIPTTHPLTLRLVLKLIFHLTGITILVVWAFQPPVQPRPTRPHLSGKPTFLLYMQHKKAWEEVPKSGQRLTN